MKTKLTENLSFLKPFLKGISKIVPLSKLAHIKDYKVQKGLNKRAQASCIKYQRGYDGLNGKYGINLLTQELVDNGMSYRYQTLEQILINLSHELAHLKEWMHTDKHFKLQAKIMIHFSSKLKELDIKDHSISINRLGRSK